MHDDRVRFELAAVDMGIAGVRRIDVAAAASAIDLLHADPALEISRGVDGDCDCRTSAISRRARSSIRCRS